MNHQEAIATKTAAGVTTLNIGVAAYLDVIQGGLAILATLLGILLTSILIYKEITFMRNKAINHKRRKSDDSSTDK